MAISARKLEDRDLYEVSYGNSTGEGTVTATFTNQADGDKSSKKAVDDGTLDVSVAKDWTGVDDVTIVHDSSGETLDSGEVTFA